MAKPIAVKNGICFAFPDVLQTPSGPTTVPVPYPNIAQLSAASGTASNVKAGGFEVILKDSTISSSSGDEAGTAGPKGPAGPCSFSASSNTVKANGKGIVRQFDPTSQNNGNAQGQVMQGLATVLVGD
jgi:hypothetical protein